MRQHVNNIYTPSKKEKKEKKNIFSISKQNIMFCALKRNVSLKHPLKVSLGEEILTLVNVNAPVVGTTSWWLHFSAQEVA